MRLRSSRKDLTFASRETEDGLRYPVENLTDYPGIGDFLAEMKAKCFDHVRICMTVAEAPGVSGDTFRRYAGRDGYFSMIFDFTWGEHGRRDGQIFREAVERWKQRILEASVLPVRQAGAACS